jgi:hypothetical protein
MHQFVMPSRVSAFQRHFAAWLLKTNTPLSHLEHAELAKAFNMAGLMAPKRKAVSGVILDSLYAAAYQHVRESIAAAGGVGVAMDGWKKPSKACPW